MSGGAVERRQAAGAAAAAAGQGEEGHGDQGAGASGEEGGQEEVSGGHSGTTLPLADAAAAVQAMGSATAAAGQGDDLQGVQGGAAASVPTPTGSGVEQQGFGVEVISVEEARGMPKVRLMVTDLAVADAMP